MFRTYIKTTLRNLSKNKGYSFLKNFGLAIGIACASFIFLWVEDELSFDNVYKNKKEVYRVMVNQENNGSITTSNKTSGALAAAIKAEMPGVKRTGRLNWGQVSTFQVGDKVVNEHGIYADSSVISMLPLPLLNGNASKIFAGPTSVIVSKKMAEKLFSSVTEAMNKTVQLKKDNFFPGGAFEITGVFEDLPQNSSYHWDWVIPYETWETAAGWTKEWNSSGTETLVQLERSADVAGINNKLVNLLKSKVGPEAPQHFLFAMSDWNLRSNFENGRQVNGKIRYINLFTLISIIIIVIACINYVNLATARSEERAREIGIRKVLGSNRQKLILYFLSESLVMSTLSILLAVGLVLLFLPAFNNMLGKQLQLALFSADHLLYLFVVWLFTGMASGIYPALYLSSFKPIQVLKGLKVTPGAGVVLIRKALVIGQFTVSIVLIISTIIILSQIRHMQARDLGYTKNQIIFTYMNEEVKKHYQKIRHELISSGYIENAATIFHGPLNVYDATDAANWSGKDPNSKLTVYINSVSADYLSTLQLKLLSGRDFSTNQLADSTNIIINESFAKLMGKEGRVGSTISIGNFHVNVIGIVKDFAYNDVYAAPMPLILASREEALIMMMRLQKGKAMKEALATVERIFKENDPNNPFAYEFLDDRFNALVASEVLIGRLSGVFAGFCMFISCLGLFGLAAYTAERRTKEIGIRKVLGANVTKLAGLLSKDFLILVLVSCIIAFPLAWYMMNRWLQEYSYRINISIWVFVIAGLAAILIALATVSYQAIKAALANPVKSLRTE